MSDAIPLVNPNMSWKHWCEMVEHVDGFDTRGFDTMSWRQSPNCQIVNCQIVSHPAEHLSLGTSYWWLLMTFHAAAAHWLPSPQAN